MQRQIIISLFAAVSLNACAAQSLGDANVWYGNHNGIVPKNTKIYICHGFGCAYKTPVSLSSGDLNKLEDILSAGKDSPAAERQAIAKAVQWQEIRVASEAGSHNDVGGFDMGNAGKRGQMDCIDESTNTNSLLLMAQKHGFLHHHKVSSPVARGFFLDGRYPHATATITEKTTGNAYAVDSWVRANGEKPNVIPIEEWFARRQG
ncbi:MAG: hypothetical protein ABJY83_03965 [Roseibium sp.]